MGTLGHSRAGRKQGAIIQQGPRKNCKKHPCGEEEAMNRCQGVLPMALAASGVGPSGHSPWDTPQDSDLG